MINNAEQQAIILNMCLHNEELKNYFGRNLSEFKESGETLSLYEDMRLVEVVLRLMDNRKFEKQPDNIKKEMIYTDYYPEQAKTDPKVYLDDRRNLCQALHNKLCKELSIPETLVRLENFKTTDMDWDLFQFYNPNTGVIYINTAIDFSECGSTELAQAVMRATYVHQLHVELRRNFTTLEKVSAKQKYLLLSLLMKTYAMAELTAEGKQRKRNSFQYNDGFSSTYVYATYATYEYLNKMFNNYKLTHLPHLDEFFEARISYVASLANPDAPDLEEYVDEEGGIVFYNPEEGEVVAEDDIEDYILTDTIDYDIDLLYLMEESDINKTTNGLIFEVFKRELDASYKDFYEFFGYETEFGFAEEFENYKETSELLKEVDELAEEE